MIIKVKTLVFCENYEYGDVNVMSSSAFKFSVSLKFCEKMLILCFKESAVNSKVR